MCSLSTSGGSLPATLYLLETLTVLVSDMEMIVPPSGVQNRALMRTTGRN